MPNKKTKVVKKSKNAKEKRKRKIMIIKNIMKIFIIIAIIVAGGVFAFTSPLFNITEIQVIGNEKYEKNIYVGLSELKINENIFKFNKIDAISKIKKNPYIDNVTIKRKLPNIVEINIEERKAKFLIELEEGQFAYIDEQGYILEKSEEKLPLLIITGNSTKIENIIPGERLLESDIEKINEILQIQNAISSNNIEQNIDKINIKNRNNYILILEKEAKEVHLGDISDLSTKMLYMKYVLNEQEGVPGIIYLEQPKVYFSPK